MRKSVPVHNSGVTGYAEDAALYQEWLQSDAQFLTAPFTSQELSVKLQRLLAGELVMQS